MRFLTTIFLFFATFFISSGCKTHSFKVKNTYSPPSFQIEEKLYGVNFLLQSDDFLKKRIVGAWECGVVAQNYQNITFIGSSQGSNSFQTKLIFRKSGKFEIIQDPIITSMGASVATGTWQLQNGVIFIDLKIKHPNLPNLKNIKLSAIAHINSADNLIWHWDTAAAGIVKDKIDQETNKKNNTQSSSQKSQFYYDSNNCLYFLYEWSGETFTPQYQKFEVSGINKTSQLEYRRLPNEDHDKKISPMPAAPENAVKTSSYGSLCASHILIKVPQNLDGDKELNKANAIYAQLLLKPEKFGDFAAKYSDCPSKTKNGYLGYFEKGQMVPEFEEATLALKENQISKPIKTSFGWHIIKREKL